MHWFGRCRIKSFNMRVLKNRLNNGFADKIRFRIKHLFLLHCRGDARSVEFTKTSVAPQGKTPVKVLLKATYSQWKALSADRVRYDEEKERIAEVVIDVLEVRFPGLRQQVEVIDVSTPLTVERFIGNYHGLQAWGVPGGGMEPMLRGFTRTLPGLANFYMAGQWAETMIGISTAAISGRNAVSSISKQDRHQFETIGK